ncbi:DUF2075 domain-containing protein [Daejeonella lutea]|uniref:Uncharacterized conserved protein n=1 Tax=Daejeonella lutea TaxID=572036 RepID=A0A1T5EBM8_9SPHI|nr:DUF2075 domain-containing protein [Daejeonella lutea]SKB81219.1 Uncharacterized conserved protein [Daejeonella lutea]
MTRFFYSSSISSFLEAPENEILGILAKNNEFALEQTQRDAWQQEIEILKTSLKSFTGGVFFEYAIPRMGRRVDVILIIQSVIFVVEFKIGEKDFLSSAIDQVWDYSLDLRNFHETSQNNLIAPILVATAARSIPYNLYEDTANDNLLVPIKANSTTLTSSIENVLSVSKGNPIFMEEWSNGRYSPTPTIIEAAIALYSEHSVIDISRSDASAINLTETSNAVSEVIRDAKSNSKKAICFVTGVPGAGKTLVGLDIATQNLSKNDNSTSVFLSGNGPLVAVLREALTRDKVRREKLNGNKITKGEALRGVKTFIQNIHHFRDECLVDESRAPFDHVAIFDEAQRAWDQVQTANFMQRKKGKPGFTFSEPEFLISCLDRHKDWAVIVCLVGGGQEIHTGEGGIAEWIASLNRSFPHWEVNISSRLMDSEYAAGKALQLFTNKSSVSVTDELHLAVSMRSFRAENVSHLVKSILDFEITEAQKNLALIKDKYPLVLTRDLAKAKAWLKSNARGTERYGIVASSQAQRLKPYAIDIRVPIDPVHWFLDPKEDVRSSYYLEDAATEFQVQGLELDWACVTWDGDFRYSDDGWAPFSFVGDKWQNIKKEARQQYIKNAYRVLLTRARQGMVIVVPFGSSEDNTRRPEYYDGTFNYLQSIDLEMI